MKRIILFSAIALFLFTLSSCEKEDNSTNIITKEAKIIYNKAIDSCGDVYMIVVKSDEDEFGKWYKPENLDIKYQKDKMLIEISYSLTGHYHDCGFGGKKEIIKVHKIKILKK